MMSLEVLLQAAQYVQDYNRRTASEKLTTPTASESDQHHNQSLTRSSAEPDRSNQKVMLNDSGSSGYLAQSDSSNCSSKNSRVDDKESHSSRPPASSSGRNKEKSRRGSAKPTTENRSVHNVLEKNRRAHLKDCFDALKFEVLDSDDEKKASHLAVLKSAVRCIRQLQRQTEQYQSETEKLTKEKQSLQQRCQELKRDALTRNPTFDISTFLRKSDDDQDRDSQATCTAPGSPRQSFSEPTSTNHRQSLSDPSSEESALTTEQKSPMASRKRKKGAVTGDSEPTVKSRKPQIKTVTDILQEFQPTTPKVTQNQSSPPSRSSSPRNLPIRLRILQDQQNGMFQGEDQVENREENGSPKTYELPVQHVPMMPGAFWTDGVTTVPFYGTPQMYPVGQYMMPVGAMGQMVMIPGAAGFQAFYQQQPPPSSTPSN